MRFRTAAAALLLLLAAAGCSDQDDAAAPSVPPPAPVSSPDPVLTAAPSDFPDASATPLPSEKVPELIVEVGPVLDIEIRDFAFSPATLAAKPGQQIRVTNRDVATHTLTAKDGTVDSNDLGQDQSFTFVAPASGSLDYFCEPHPQMTGRIDVT